MVGRESPHAIGRFDWVYFGAVDQDNKNPESRELAMPPMVTTNTTITTTSPPLVASTHVHAANSDGVENDDARCDRGHDENSRGFEELIANIKAFLFHAYNTANGEDLTELKDQSTKIFHPDLIKIYNTSSSSGQTMMDREQVVQESIHRHHLGFRPKVFRYKKIDATSFSSYLRFVNDDSVMLCHQVYHISKDTNKIIRIAASAPEMVQKVSGQMSPTSGFNLCGTCNHRELLSEQEFCAKVYTPPLEVGDKLLDCGRCMLPVHIQYEFIRVFLEIHKPSGSLFGSYFKAANNVDYGVIPISDTRRLPYADGAHLKRLKKRLGKPTRILLRDANEKDVAKCNIHRGVLDLGVLDHIAATIYGTSPLCTRIETAKDDAAADDDGDNRPRNDDEKNVTSDDRNSGSSIQQDKAVYYPWFQVNAIDDGGGDDHSIKGSMYFVSVWTESSRQFQPYLKILPVPTAEKSRKNEGASSFCFAVVDYFQGQVHLGIIQKKTSSNHSGNSTSNDQGDERNGRIQVDIAPGVDPAMMICLAVIVNDMTA